MGLEVEFMADRMLGLGTWLPCMYPATQPLSQRLAGALGSSAAPCYWQCCPQSAASAA